MEAVTLCIGIILVNVYTGYVSAATRCPEGSGCHDIKCTSSDILHCKNGFCNTTTNLCQCYPCWSGEKCNIPNNRHQPRFAKEKLDVFYDPREGSFVTTAIADDADKKVCSGLNVLDCPCGDVLYSIIRVSDGSLTFTIDPHTGVIGLDHGHVQDLPSDGGTVALTVLARNQIPSSAAGLKEKTATCEVRIHLPEKGKTSGENGIGSFANMGTAHSRRRRESGIPSEVSIFTEKLHPFNGTEEVEVSESVPLKLTVSLPAGSTSLLIELLAQMEDASIFTLHDPQVTRVGSNIQGFTTTSPAPTLWSSLNNTKHDRVNFEKESVTNDGSDVSQLSSSQIEVRFDATLQYNDDLLCGGKDYRISTGVLYQAANSMLVNQVRITGVAGSSTGGSEDPVVAVTGPSTLAIDSSADYDIDLTLMNDGDDITLMVSAANFSQDPVMEINSLEVISIGSNFHCIQGTVINASYTIHGGTSTPQMAVLTFGKLVNARSRNGNDNPVDNTLSIHANIKLRPSEEIVLGTSYWFGVVLEAKGVIIESQQIAVTLGYPKMPNDPVVEFFPIHGSDVIIGGPAGFVLEIEIPENITSSLVVEFEVPHTANGDRAFSICSAKMFHSGDNMPMVSRVDPQYLTDGQVINNTVFDLGDVTNIGSSNSVDANKLKFYMEGVLLNDIPGLSDMPVLGVTAGIRYQTTEGDMLMLKQALITPVTEKPPASQSSLEPSFAIEPRQNGTIMTGDEVSFDVRVTFPSMSTPLLINITMPTKNGDPLLVVTNVTLDSIGANFGCEQTIWERFPFSGEIQDSSTALVDLGVLMNNGISHLDHYRVATSADDVMVIGLTVRLRESPSPAIGPNISFDVQFIFGGDRRTTESVVLQTVTTGNERPTLDVSIDVGDTTNLQQGDEMEWTFTISHSANSTARAHHVTLWLMVPSYITMSFRNSSYGGEVCVETTDEGGKFKFDEISFSDNVQVWLVAALDTSYTVPGHVGVFDTTIPVLLAYHSSDGVDESGTTRLTDHYTSAADSVHIPIKTSPVLQLFEDYDSGFIYDKSNETLFVCMRAATGSRLKPRCSYSADFGQSWTAVDSSISTINFIDHDNGTMYGISLLGRHIMSTEDQGRTWATISEEHFRRIFQSRRPWLTEASVVPSVDYGDTSYLDLQVTDSISDTTDCGVYCSNPSRGLCYNRFGTNVINDPSMIISASSKFFQDDPSAGLNYGPERGALFAEKTLEMGAAWAPFTADANEWIQVDFGFPRHVTGVTIQGRGDSSRSQWVTSFRVLYSIDGETFYNSEALDGTTDQHSVHLRYLDRPIFARFFRINPLTWNVFPSLRFDLIGCNDWV